MSDHVPIFINIKKEKTIHSKTTFTGRTYKNFEEEIFINKLREAGFAEIPIHSPEPNQCWERLYNTIIDVLNVMAPLRTSTFRKDRPEWLTADLIEIMKDRDRAMKLACKSKLTTDKKIARVLRNHVNKAVKSAKSEYLLTKLDTYKKDPKKFWQAINDILPHSKSSAINIIEMSISLRLQKTSVYTNQVEFHLSPAKSGSFYIKSSHPPSLVCIITS